MRIIYIANTELPTERARGLQIMKSCEAFAKNGVTVSLVTPRNSNSSSEDPFAYYSVRRIFALTQFRALHTPFLSERLGFYVRSIFFACVAVASFFSKRKIALLYARETIVLFFLSVTGFRYAAEIHDYRSARPRWFMRRILHGAHAIVVNSEGTLEALRSQYPGISHKKILVAPNGVDVDYFAVDETREQAREMLGLGSDGPIIGYVGRLETLGIEKGIPELIEAFKLLAKDWPQASLYIVGGPDTLVEKYKSLVSGYSVRLTGQVEYRHVPHYMRAMDVLVLPQISEYLDKTMSSIKLVEYMASGKSIVVPDKPSIRAYVTTDEAFLVPSGSIRDLAEAIRQALEAPASERGSRARAKAQRLSWTERARNILAFIS